MGQDSFLAGTTAYGREEIDRIKTYFMKSSLYFLAALALILLLKGCTLFNRPPTVEITKGPEEVMGGFLVQYQCAERDLDMDPISLLWSATTGTFPSENAGNTVQWLAPETGGTETISVTASDGTDESTFDLEVEVIPRETGQFVDVRDDHEYEWIRIGRQYWMAENLAYLPGLALVADEGSYELPRHYVYDFHGLDPILAKQHPSFGKYGVLYNWPAAQQACPAGWHLPDKEEWDQLAHFVYEQNYQAYDLFEQNYTDRVGYYLKSKIGWDWNEVYGKDGNGIDKYGFGAVPAGYADLYNNQFTAKGGISHWWTRESSSGSSAWFWLMTTGEGLTDKTGLKYQGHSVRCVKD